MKTTVGDIAYYVRSKNAGPFWITIDIFCDTDESYQRFATSSTLNADSIANTYGVEVNDIKLFYLPNLKVMKISYPRHCPQGGRDERDMHAGQQYMQMLGLPV